MAQTIAMILIYLSSVMITRSYMIFSMKHYKIWYQPETWFLPLINLILVAKMVIRRIDLHKFSIYKCFVMVLFTSIHTGQTVIRYFNDEDLES